MNILVLEGNDDIFMRLRQCLSGRGTGLYSSREEWENSRYTDDSALHVAIIGASFLQNRNFRHSDWELAQGLPVLWIGANRPSGVPRHDKASLVLNQDFSCAQLRSQLRQFGLENTAPFGYSSVESPVQALADEAPRILYRSQVMQDLHDDCLAYAAIDSNVLVTGETGAGKELFARTTALGHPVYGQGPFVAVNCGAIPDHLFESLFFGHAKGAFTGALRAHRGYLAQAQGGTLYLDEIGDLPQLHQVKLLRALEDGMVLPVGAGEPVQVDFRLIAATNHDLLKLVRQGRFRSDLYYRIATIELHVPSLEERGVCDKSLLFRHALQDALRHFGVTEVPLIPIWLDQAAQTRKYPGNVRELINVATRVAVSYARLMRFDRERCLNILSPSRIDKSSKAMAVREIDVRLEANDGRAEKDRILSALNSHGWKRQDAADDLGISRKTLWEKMRKYDLLPAGQSSEGDTIHFEQESGGVS